MAKYQLLENPNEELKAGDETCNPDDEIESERGWKLVSDSWFGTRLSSMGSWCPGYIYRRLINEDEWAATSRFRIRYEGVVIEFGSEPVVEQLYSSKRQLDDEWIRFC